MPSPITLPPRLPCPVHPETPLRSAVLQSGATVTWCVRCHLEAWQPITSRFPTITKETYYVEAC